MYAGLFNDFTGDVAIISEYHKNIDLDIIMLSHTTLYDLQQILTEPKKEKSDRLNYTGQIFSAHPVRYGFLVNIGDQSYCYLT